MLELISTTHTFTIPPFLVKSYKNNNLERDLRTMPAGKFSDLIISKRALLPPLKLISQTVEYGAGPPQGV